MHSKYFLNTKLTGGAKTGIRLSRLAWPQPDLYDMEARTDETQRTTAGAVTQ